MKLIKFIGLLFFLLSSIGISFSKDTDKVIQGSDYYTKELLIDQVQIFIHYPGHKNKFKEKIEKVLIDEISYFHQYFNYRPKGPVHFIVKEFANDANGMATVFPYNSITLNDFPPLQSDYLNYSKDWIKQLVVHEYIHILTMDMTSGFIDYLRTIFGSMVKTNGVMPAWMLEGVSVWAESKLPNEGRANSKMVKYEVYQHLKNDRNCTDISCLDYPMYYPYGHLRYWMGGLFLTYLEKLKPNTISCIFNEHSGRVPFFLNSIFENCYGQNVDDLFSAFKKDFIKENQYFENFCPINDCNELQKLNLVAKIDWQLGNCNNQVILRNKSDSNNNNAAHQIFNYKTNKILNTTYPIKRIQKILNKCVVSLLEFNGQVYDTVFYELRNNEFIKLNSLKNSEVLAINNDTIVPIHYLNGSWVLKENSDIYPFSKDLNLQRVTVKDQVITFENKNGEVKKNKLVKTQIEQIKVSDKNYNPLHYLRPSYLLILFSNIANLESTNLVTGLVDPIGRHAFDFQFDFYNHNEIQSPVPRFMAYQYNNNLSTYTFGQSKLYSFSLFNGQINESQNLFANYQKTFFLNSIPNIFSIGLVKQNLEDFISKRETMSYEVGYSLTHMNNQIKSLYQSLRFDSVFTQTKVLGMKEFYGIRLGLMSSHNVGDFLKLSADAKLSKFFKDDLKRGFYSAGGFSSFFTGNVNHQFFAVNQGDIFGNEIITSRINLDYNLFDLYFSKSLLPIYLRNISLISGLEYAKAKYIAADSTLFINEYAQAAYLGLNFNTVFFYGVPTSIKLLMTNLFYPSSSTGALLFFNASLF